MSKNFVLLCVWLAFLVCCDMAPFILPLLFGR